MWLTDTGWTRKSFECNSIFDAEPQPQLLLETGASLQVTRHLTTRSKKLLVARGITTSSDFISVSNLVNPKLPDCRTLRHFPRWQCIEATQVHGWLNSFSVQNVGIRQGWMESGNSVAKKLEECVCCYFCLFSWLWLLWLWLQCFFGHHSCRICFFVALLLLAFEPLEAVALVGFACIDRCPFFFCFWYSHWKRVAELLHIWWCGAYGTPDVPSKQRYWAICGLRTNDEEGIKPSETKTLSTGYIFICIYIIV